jgi:hypothetical protein
MFFVKAYAFSFFLALLTIKIRINPYFLRAAPVLFNFFFWYIGFFFCLFYSSFIFLLYGAFRTILKFKIWAIFLVCLMLSFDNNFFLYLFVQPFMELLNSFGSFLNVFFHWLEDPVFKGSTVNLGVDEWRHIQKAKWKYLAPIQLECNNLFDFYLACRKAGY